MSRKSTQAEGAAPDPEAQAGAAPAGPPARDDPPAPPGPGRWRWNAAEGRHERLSEGE